MLTHLSIRNVVLIEKADISFANGLCVLTGETGAGKSILLDALGLVLGGRAEARLVRANTDKAQVVATFELTSPLPAALVGVLDEADITLEDESLIIRRSLNGDGKSKAFINDEPVSAKLLKQIGEMLVEIHGQHQQRGLLNEALHGQLLDAYGAMDKELAATKETFTTWRDVRNELKALESKIEQAAKDKDYLEHMQRELEQLAPEEGEDEVLSDTRTEMMQVEKMAGVLDDALKDLSNPKDISEMLRSAQATLSRSTLKVAERFSPAIDALEKAMIEVEEARGCLEDLGRSNGFDQYELERVEERLFALKAAGRKYNLPVDELPKLYDEVTEKLSMLGQQEYALGGLQKQVKESHAAYVGAAEALRAARAKVSIGLESAICDELSELKMQATRFKVVAEPLPESGWNARGMDALRFEVATNKGTDFGALNAIASGGELSRFMLALAVVLADVAGTPTMIFDEIDTGTGGAVADAIGGRLQVLGDGAQVLVVTHLPQVAARGAQHHFIQKQEKDDATHTYITELDAKSRHEELARMISGAQITDEARQAARKLMEAAA